MTETVTGQIRKGDRLRLIGEADEPLVTVVGFHRQEAFRRRTVWLIVARDDGTRRLARGDQVERP